MVCIVERHVHLYVELFSAAQVVRRSSVVEDEAGVIGGVIGGGGDWVFLVGLSAETVAVHPRGISQSWSVRGCGKTYFSSETLASPFHSNCSPYRVSRQRASHSLSSSTAFSPLTHVFWSNVLPEPLYPAVPPWFRLPSSLFSRSLPASF